MSLAVDITPELQELIRNISQRNLYGGNKIPDSIMKQFEIETTDNSAGILVPYWIPVLEHGRGPRKSNRDTGLWKRIYAWMQKRGLFTSRTPQGRVNEAKSVTWYINKYGNKQFRTKVFVDVYTSETEEFIKKIDQKYSLAIGKITSDIL